MKPTKQAKPFQIRADGKKKAVKRTSPEDNTMAIRRRIEVLQEQKALEEEWTL
ncbi:hypothetical protein V9N52_004319 [Vibrio navarrensis]